MSRPREEKSKGKITIRFDFSGHSQGELIGQWLRDIAADGSLEVYVVALWETGNAVGYYSGKLKTAQVAGTRARYAGRLAAAKGSPQ